MSLTARLSGFFLGALAVVLAGFATTLYAVARTYLTRQVDERLTAALDTLSAAAEVHPDGVEWEPDDRVLPVGRDAGEDQVRWTIHDGRGRLVERSRNLHAESLHPAGDDTAAEARGGCVAERDGQRWRLLRRDLWPSQLKGPPGTHHKEDPSHHNYPQLVLTAGLSLRPLETTLFNLAATLTGLSLGVFALAAVAGRRLCRRALRPLTRMAEAARSMGAGDRDRRLPPARTADELEDLGSAFNDLLGRLQEAFERQRRFTGDASHQLRTPLTAMLGQVEVALRRERSAEQYRDALAVVQGQAVQLRQIVEMLLFLARADADARLPNLEEIDLGAWLTEQLNRWAEHPRRTDIHLEVGDGTPRRARAQPALLGQLLDNLLDNACKYSEPGTPVTVRLGGGPGAVTVTVEDAGCGIGAEELPHIFEPFYRSDHARRLGRAGAGLGLAVAQRVALAFGGSLAAESEPGEGSHFVVRLPALIAPELEKAAGLPPPAPVE